MAPALVVLTVVLAALLAPGAASAQLSVVGAISNATSLSGALSVGVSGNEAYAPAYWPGQLTAVNLSNPAAPAIDGSTPSTPSLQNATNLTFAGHYAFVVSKNRNGAKLGTLTNDDGVTGNSLTIIDISNPLSPTVLGSVRDPGRLFGGYSVAVQGNYAYVAYQGLLPGQPQTPDTSTGGFTVIDITNPGGPAIVANIDNGSLSAPYTNALYHATSVAISGTHAYVSAFLSSAITVIDISNPLAPAVVAKLRDGIHLVNPNDLAIQGSYLYVANQTSGTNPQLAIVNIATPTAPAVIGSLNSPYLNGAYRIRVRGNFAYLAASGASSIGAVDISDPVAPRLADYVQDAAHLASASGLDLDSSSRYVIAASPKSSTESVAIYPPYTNTTGTISVIDLIPNPIKVTIAPSSEPPAQTGMTAANFSFSVNDMVSTVACQLDGGGYVPCTSPTTANYSGLTTGSHTFTVQATDAAGNQSTDSYTWHVAVGAPLPGTPGPSITDATRSSGLTALGDTLDVSTGTWSGNPTITYSYQWQHCQATCTNISGASGSSYVVAQADVGTTLQAIVTAHNGQGSASATSAPTTTVGAPPQNTAAPTLSMSGAAAVGNPITVSNGSWNVSPSSYAYQWLRCTAAGTGCGAIAGAIGSTYAPVAADAGQRLEAQVIASNAYGSSAPATSAQTNPLAGPPVSTVAPAITGSPAVGQTLVVSNGSWTNNPTSYHAQWLRCTAAGTGCGAIAGASGSTYAPVVADLGARLEAQVIASNAYGSSAPATSAQTNPVGSPPVNTVAPAITGSAVVGQVLVVSNGSWNHSPSSYGYQWLRCSAAGTGCGAIVGAISSTYAAVAADVGHRLSAIVTAANQYGTGQGTAGPTSVVAAAPTPPANTAPPIISGTHEVGATLSASAGTWTGTPSSFSFQWMLCRASCLAISGATQRTYTVALRDLGDVLKVTVIAHSPQGSSAAQSREVGPVYPSLRTLDALLDKLLIPHGRAAALGSVRRHGLRVTITAPSAGKLVLSWYYLPKGASLTRHRRGAPKPVLIAVVTVTFSRPSQRKTVTIRLTRAGVQRLAKARQLSLIAQGGFLPAGGPWVYQRHGFHLT